MTCGDAKSPAGSCWKRDGKVVPMRVTEVGSNGVFRETLGGLAPDSGHSECYCDDKNNLYLYEPEPMTNETLTAGALVKNKSGLYFRVLAVLGGEGELRSYVVSLPNEDPTGERLKRVYGAMTAYELTKDGYIHYVETAPVEMTVAEISKKLGVTVKVVE